MTSLAEGQLDIQWAHKFLIDTTFNSSSEMLFNVVKF